MSKNIGSPVTFSEATETTAKSRVIFLGADDRRNVSTKPVSNAEATAIINPPDDDSETSTTEADDDTPTVVVEDSFFDAPVDYILKERHKDIANGTKVIIKNDEGSRTLPSVVVASWQMLAGDLNEDHAKALGYESLVALADDRGLHDDQPITVIQIER